MLLSRRIQIEWLICREVGDSNIIRKSKNMPSNGSNGCLSSHYTSNGKSKDSWEDLAGQLRARHVRPHVLPRSGSGARMWLIGIFISIFVWTCVVQITSLREIWQPQLLRACFTLSTSRHTTLDQPGSNVIVHRSPPYESNGYLIIHANGGLNQMRAGICDNVAIAKHMKVTLVIPELDKTSFWSDPSNFSEVFDTDHFISSLEDEVIIVKQVPENLLNGDYKSMHPQSWSPATYYSDEILPIIQKYKVLRFNRTDARLANNGLPLDMQNMRCRANYNALRFTPRIEELGRKMIHLLQQNGSFIVLHLRYEMDMLAFSGCTQGCTKQESDDLTKMRYDFESWKEKKIVSEEKRKKGLCPLTPEETTLVLRALGYNRTTQIYIAAGDIYGSDRRMANLHEAYPNVIRKEMLLSEEEMSSFQKHSTQKAALDYLVSIASDIFIPTYDGNMAKQVEGHRRYLSYHEHGPLDDLNDNLDYIVSTVSPRYLQYHPTVLLDRKKLVELIDLYESNQLHWVEFANAVKQSHKGRLGFPRKRLEVIGKPKEEDYFYSNPQECMRVHE